MNRGPAGLGRVSRRTEGGFSLAELLVAATLCTMLATVLAGVVGPAQAAFDSVPAMIDVQQRAWTGVEVLAAAIRSAGADVAATTDVGSVSALMPAVLVADPTPGGGFAEQFSSIYVVAPVVNAAQGVLDRDQPGPLGVLTLGAGFGCPDVLDVCGFTPGAHAAIVDGTGRFDVFIVASTSPALREVTPGAALSAAYPVGSAVVEVTAQRFRLAVQNDGSRALVRDTLAGATQPVVDNVMGLGFEAWGGRPPTRVNQAQLEDGPWMVGGPTGLYDATALDFRRIDFWIRVGAASDSTRTLARRSAMFLVPDRTLHASMTLRNKP